MIRWVVLYLFLSSTSWSLTFSEAELLFEKLKTEASIPYDFPDGCHAKAHAAVLFFEDHGVIAEKFFIEGNLFYRDRWGPSFWTFHVVPTIQVEDRDEWVVFDPYVFDRLVVASELVNLFERQSGGFVREVYRTPRFVYSPQERHLGVDSYEQYYLDDMETVFAQIRRRLAARLD